MRNAIVAGTTIFFLIGSSVPAPSLAQNSPVNKVMLEKLQCSQKLLEGIAISDFVKISNNAERLIQLSNSEEWMVLRTPRYEMHSNEFRRAVESLIQKSKSKSIDGATLAFFEMTMSCVRCHQYVREVREARLPSSSDLVARDDAQR